MKSKAKIICSLFALSLLFNHCSSEADTKAFQKFDYSKHEVEPSNLVGMEKGESYLSVYSEIYSNTGKRTHSLTVTISIRNTSSTQKIYVTSANYFDTSGKLIKEFIKNPIFVAPLETIEIVIDKSDSQGGTGGNMVFDWMKLPETSDPIFEGIMISTSGQQGISFVTQSVRTI